MESPTVRIRLVGEELRRYREALGLTLDQVAERIGISKPKLSKMETGNYGQRCDEVAGLLAIYGVKGEERKELLELANHPHQSGLWVRHSPLAQRIAALTILEARATKMINFECELIPGLLQTVPYIEALMRNVGLITDEELISERVAARVRRQGALRKFRTAQYTAVIAETALHNMIGDRTVMRDQLDYLAEVAQRPNVILRVIPRAVGNHPGLEGPFLRLSFHDRRSVVVLVNRTSSLYLEDDEDLMAYNHLLVELLSVALDHDQSVELVRDLAIRLA